MAIPEIVLPTFQRLNDSCIMTRFIGLDLCQLVRYLHHIESHSYQVTIRIRTIQLRVMMTFHIFGYGIITQTTNNIHLHRVLQRSLFTILNITNCPSYTLQIVV
jgi:hypothetical protein